MPGHGQRSALPTALGQPFGLSTLPHSPYCCGILIDKKTQIGGGDKFTDQLRGDRFTDLGHLLMNALTSADPPR